MMKLNMKTATYDCTLKAVAAAALFVITTTTTTIIIPLVNYHYYYYYYTISKLSTFRFFFLSSRFSLCPTQQH